MTKSSDKNSHRFERNMANDNVVGITIGCTVMFTKGAWT